MLNAISIKGDTTLTGSYSSFGAYYQTYMYAFIIGYKLDELDYITAKDSNPETFAPIGQWRPGRIRDFIYMLILNESESFGYTLEVLEDASEESIEVFVTEFIRQIEGYANAGLRYLQEKWDNERIEFQDPFVFVNIIDELNASL